MNPANPSYIVIDTTISSKRYYELEEIRLSKSGKLTAWLTSDTSSDLTTSAVITFKPKDKMSTLARNIKRKLKLNYMINLRITDTEGRLNITGTADEAGLKDGMSVMVSKVMEESSTET